MNIEIFFIYSNMCSAHWWGYTGGYLVSAKWFLQHKITSKWFLIET
jgi:hypothetical protein